MLSTLKQLKNILKISTLLLILLSIVTPFSYSLIKGYASSGQSIQIEIEYKDGSSKSVFTTEEELQVNPVPELQPVKELPTIESEFSPQQYQQIEEEEAVTYDDKRFATVDETTLQNLGYSSQEIADIKAMTDYYNSNPVLSFRFIELDKAPEVSLGVSVSAACQHEYNVTFYSLHSEVYMNQCLIGDIKKGVATGDFVATVVALKFPIAIPVAIGLAGVLLYAEILDATSGQCSDEGANLNFMNNYANPLMPTPIGWVSSVC